MLIISLVRTVLLLMSASLCLAVTIPKIKLINDGTTSYFFCEAPSSRTDNCSTASIINESRWLWDGKNSTGYGTVQGRQFRYSDQSPETEGSLQCSLGTETGWSDPVDSFIEPNVTEAFQMVYAKAGSQSVEFICQVLVGQNTRRERLKRVSLEVHMPCDSLRSTVNILYHTRAGHLNPDEVLLGRDGVAIFYVRDFTVRFNYSSYMYLVPGQSLCMDCSIFYYTNDRGSNTSPKTARTRIVLPPVSNPPTVEPTTPAPCEQGENDVATTTSLYRLHFTRAQCSEYKGGEVIRYLLTKHTCLESDTYSVAVSCEAGEETAILFLTSTVGVTIETLSTALSDISTALVTLPPHTSTPPAQTTLTSSETTEATPCHDAPSQPSIIVIITISVLSTAFVASLIIHSIHCVKYLKCFTRSKEQQQHVSSQQMNRQASDEGNTPPCIPIYASGCHLWYGGSRREEGNVNRREVLPRQPSSESIAELANHVVVPSLRHEGSSHNRMQPRVACHRNAIILGQVNTVEPQYLPFIGMSQRAVLPVDRDECAEVVPDMSPHPFQVEDNSTCVNTEQPYWSGHVTEQYVIPNPLSTYQTRSDSWELRREAVPLSTAQGGMPASETQGYSEGMQGDFV